MVEYNGKTLLNNVLVTRYFKQISGKKFFEEFNKFNEELKRKKNKFAIEDYDDFEELFLNIYLAGRCAFEKRLLTVEEQDNELAEIPMCDEKFFTVITDFMDDIVKTAEKNSNSIPSKKK